jgi:hypothetical protein
MSRGGIVIRRPVALLGLGLLAVSLAACSSGSNIKLDEPATTVAPAAATVAPTTTATTVPETLTPTTVAPVLTEAPTTTISLEDQVRAGVETTFWAKRTCLVNPEVCDVSTFTVPGSFEAERIQNLVDRNVSEGLHGFTVPEFNSYEVLDLRLGIDQRSAVVSMCVIDGNWLMDGLGTEDRSDDVVINDEVFVLLVEGSLVLTEDQWRWESYVGTRQPEGATGCVA